MAGIAAVALLAASPIFAGALTIDELRAQVTALLAQIEALQQQLAATTGAPAQTTGTSTTTGATGTAQGTSGAVACPQISRSLQFGSTGDDVSRLQRYLALDPAIYPEALVTGYYGALTEAAVKRWQAKHFVVSSGTPASTGWGVVGPRTAAVLAIQCPPGTVAGGTGSVGGFIKVTPITGPAPLTVTIEATVNTPRSCNAPAYQLDFGDTTSPAQIQVPQGNCNERTQVVTHQYTKPGTYTVTLRAGSHQTSATVTVTGSAQQPDADMLNATPTAGSSPLAVVFSGFVNAAGECNPPEYKIDFGDNQSVVVPVQGCAAHSYSVTHLYGGGNFIARLYRGGTEIATRSISVSGTSETDMAQFSVTPGSGGDPKQVRVEFDLSTSCTGYELDWGDGSSKETQAQGTCEGSSVTKQFTHTYTDTGSYTITLKRGTNLSLVDTAALVISE